MSAYTVGARYWCERLGECRIVRVHPMGTIDVECLANGRWYRVTGLAIA